MDPEKVLFENNVPYTVTAQIIERYPIHWHEGVTEILLPIRGGVEVVSNFEHIRVKEGDFVFVNHRSIHSIRSSAKTHCYG